VIETEGRGAAVTSARPFPPPFDRLGAVLWTIVKQKMSTQYDIAIVGGGIVGLATAVALSGNRSLLSWIAEASRCYVGVGGAAMSGMSGAG